MEFLEKIWDAIREFAIAYVITPISSMNEKDIIDVLLLAVLLFEVYRFTRNGRAGRVMIGLLVVVFGSIVAVSFDLPALSYIVKLFAASAFFSIVLLFQPELRDALEKLGNITLLNPGSDSLPRKKMSQAKQIVDETVDAVFEMAKSKTGALIVFEGLTKLGDYIATGKIVDARVTSHLLKNIFFAPAPLHDGALVIRDMRIWAASCVLPSTNGHMDFGNMGTRHRAAVGVTEVSDALVVVVSEQTGVVSVAQNGRLLRDIDETMLTDILMTYIAGNAYLRVKRANMRKEYLEMLDNVSRVDPPVVSKKDETLDLKKIEKASARHHANDEQETDHTLEDTAVTQPSHHPARTGTDYSDNDI